jgi:hypothetical protein
MPRIVRILPAILLVLGSHAAAAQEAGSDTARAIAETRNGIGRYMSDVRARTTELKRKIDVLGDLTDAADAISPVAMGLSLTRSRQKVENAKHTANQEPPLGEPVPTVLDIVSQLVNTPPFGMPADQLRARLFVEISRLEEDILRQSETFQREADGAESMERSLEQITAGLRSTAAAGTRALLQTRRRALKSGS